uniref:Reverse transcriptase n=1 Tax=Powellomyces hirtus TaxID=109895 RepID=A0A4P8NQ14_9FUNG|nr:reverse transcriptase [Powellomyces hirtus]
MSVRDQTNKTLTPTQTGMPQGLPISPVICILALDQSGFLDTLKEGTLVQYVDDGVGLGETENHVLNASRTLNNRSRDGILINHDKSKITNSKSDSLKFLGITLCPPSPFLLVVLHGLSIAYLTLYSLFLYY